MTKDKKKPFDRLEITEPLVVFSPGFHCGECPYLLHEKEKDLDAYYCTHEGAAAYYAQAAKTYIGTDDAVPGWCPVRIKRGLGNW